MMSQRKAALSRFSPLSLRHLALLLLTLVGCATPVGVHKVSHEEAYRTLTASVLSGDELSEPTVQVLNRAGLGEAYSDAPVNTISELHQKVFANRDNDLLYALAELSFQHGVRSGEDAYFLSAAFYAYAFLFPETLNDTPDSFDPRFRTAVDLYNQGLIRGFTVLPAGAVNLKSGHYRLPFGRLEVKVDPEEFFYGPYRMVDFADASQLIPRGLRNRYRWPGIGGPLVACLQKTEVTGAEEFARVPPTLRVPVSAVLKFDNVKDGLRTGELSGELTLYTEEEATAVAIEGRQVALEYAQTAALAATLEGARVYSLELKGLLTGDFKLIRETTRYNNNIFLRRPSSRGKFRWFSYTAPPPAPRVGRRCLMS